jgi:hypothetical protein
MTTLQIKNNVFLVDDTIFLDKYSLKYWKYSKKYKTLYFNDNKQYINYVELIKGKIPKNHIYKVKNNNYLDLRYDNIYFYDLTPSIDNGIILKDSMGHKVGNRWVNPHWKIQVKLTKPILNTKMKNVVHYTYYMMYIKEDKYIKFSVKSYDILKNNSWFISNTGYPSTYIKGKTKYLHHLLIEDMGYNPELLKIEHINEDRLDNRLTNIKIINPYKIKELNDKVRPKINFRRLKLQGKDMPTWISYNQPYQNHGEYFEVKVNMKHDKNIINIRKKTTKSYTISIQQKFIDALLIRGKIIIDYPELLDNKIDDNQFNDINSFIKYNKKLITKNAKKAGIELDPKYFKYDKMKFKNKPRRKMDSFPEKCSYNPSDLPKYTTYIAPKNNRGSYIEYKKLNTKTNQLIRFKTTTKKSVLLDKKILEIKSLIKECIN